MNRLKLLFVKGLKYLNVLRFFNFSLSKEINNKTVLIPFRNGVGITNYNISEDWLTVLLHTFLNSKSNTFIDVGVNIGQTLLKVKTINQNVKYIGFEPNSSCTSYTQYLAKINNFTNCIIQNVALTSKIGILDLEKSYDVDLRASIVSNLRPNFFIDKDRVMAIDYSSFYLEEKIDFIKIDVEGSELEVLQGMKDAILLHKPLITCEVLDSYTDEVHEFTQNRATELSELIHSLDYKIIRLITFENSIVEYEHVEKIKIVVWTPESEFLNDYLFYPQSIENYVLEKLKRISIRKL